MSKGMDLSGLEVGRGEGVDGGGMGDVLDCSRMAILIEPASDGTFAERVAGRIPRPGSLADS